MESRQERGTGAQRRPRLLCAAPTALQPAADVAASSPLPQALLTPSARCSGHL